MRLLQDNRLRKTVQMIRYSLLLALVSGVFVVSALSDSPRDGQSRPAVARAQNVVPSEDDRLAAALYRKIDLAFTDASLDEVADWLGKQLGVPATIDRETFAAAGIAPDVAFNLSLKQVSLFATMTHLFGETEIAWTIHKGELLLTTADRAKACEIVRVYPVGDFVLRRERFGRVFVDEYELGAVSGGCDGPWWDLDEDFGYVALYDDLLVARHSWAMQFRIADFLAKVRAIDRRQTAGDVTPVPASVGDGDAAVLKALEQKVSLDVANMPIKKFAEHVAKLASVNVLVRRKWLDDAGLDETVTISGTAKDQPLADALAELLGDVELKWDVLGEALVITTKNEERVVTWVYPVADLANDAAAIDDDDLREYLPMLIQSTVAPTTWPGQTGPGPLDLAAHSRLLLVEQSADVHRQIGQLLGKLRAVQVQANERRTAERGNGDKSDDDPIELQTYSASTIDATTGKVRAIHPAEIVPVVRDLVEPKRWSEPGVSISALGDRIVVRHRRSVQRQVRELMQTIELAE
jgi:hypothetical protein